MKENPTYQELEKELENLKLLYNSVKVDTATEQADLLLKNNELLTSEEELRATNEELIATTEALKESNNELIIKREKLQKSKEKYQALFKNTASGFTLNEVVYDEFGKPYDLRLIEANPAVEKQTGRKNKDLLGKTMRETNPNVEEAKIQFFLDVAKNRKPVKIEMFNDISSTYYQLKVFSPQKNRVAIVIDNISKQKLAENELKFSEEKFSTIFQASQDVISLTSTTTGKFLEVNKAFEKVFEYTRAETIGKTALELVWNSQEDRDEITSKIKGKRNSFFPEVNYRTKSGKKKLVNLFVTIIRINNIPYYLSIAKDVTGEKDREKRLTKAIINAEERERNRFSKELHDGLGPILSTVNMYFSWLVDDLEVEKKELLIKNGVEAIQEAISTVEEISNNLTPRILNTFGLSAALQTFLRRLKNVSEIEIIYKTEFEDRFEINTEATIYRVFTELINNTLKHAEASVIKIDLSYNKKKKIFLANYCDNGIGFDFDYILKNKAGFGLLNMQQRIKTLGGFLNFETKETKGIKVSIKLVDLQILKK